jgi:hypothetical protein
VVLEERFDDDPIASGRWTILDELPESWSWDEAEGTLQTSSPVRPCRGWGLRRPTETVPCDEGPAFVRSRPFDVGDGSFTIEFDAYVQTAEYSHRTAMMFLHRADGADPRWRLVPEDDPSEPAGTQRPVFEDHGYLVNPKLVPGTTDRISICARAQDESTPVCEGLPADMVSTRVWYRYHLELCGDRLYLRVVDRDADREVGLLARTVDVSPYPGWERVAVMFLAEDNEKRFDNVVVRRGADCSP